MSEQEKVDEQEEREREDLIIGKGERKERSFFSGVLPFLLFLMADCTFVTFL